MDWKILALVGAAAYFLSRGTISPTAAPITRKYFAGITEETMKIPFGEPTPLSSPQVAMQELMKQELAAGIVPIPMQAQPSIQALTGVAPVVAPSPYYGYTPVVGQPYITAATSIAAERAAMFAAGMWD